MDGREELFIRKLTIKKSRDIMHVMVHDSQLANRSEEGPHVQVIRFHDTVEILIALAETQLGGLHCFI